MKKILSQLFADRLIRQSTLLTLLFILFSAIVVIFTWQSLPPIVPLYNQASWGDPRLAAKIFLFLPSLIAAAFVIINLIFARLCLHTMPLVARFLSITNTFCALLVFIFIIRTLQLII